MFKFRCRLSVILLLVLGCALFCAPGAAVAEKRFYAGLAGSYQLTNLSIWDDTDWDGAAWGVNAKFGYRLAQTLFLQLDVDYIPSIDGEWESDRSLGGEVKVLTGMVSLKGYFPGPRVARPYVLAGAGVMHYNISPNSTTKLLGFDSADNRRTSLCYKVGGGIDFMLHPHFSIGLDGNYTVGTNRVEGVEYFNFSLGAAFHF